MFLNSFSCPMYPFNYDLIIIDISSVLDICESSCVSCNFCGAMNILWSSLQLKFSHVHSSLLKRCYDSIIGSEPRCEKRDTIAVQVSSQVLSWRCLWRAHSGNYTGIVEGGKICVCTDYFLG